MKISVLIPTKNEPSISGLVKKVHESLKNYNHEVIVIDKSNSPPKITDAKVIIQKSDGLGRAVLEGLKYATGDVVVTMDGDFSHNPEYLPKLIQKVDECDIILGSRYVPEGKTEDKFIRKIISQIANKFAIFLLDLNVKDCMSGFVVIKKNVYENLELNPIGYKINLETIFKAKKNGFKICEVPITFHKRIKGKSKFGLRETLRTIWFIFKLKLSN
jgi:dolichol-phosphate mannosyltransferase